MLENGETVIVVARDSGLRRSFVFALQAEGYRVEPHTTLLSAVSTTRAAGALCALVDEGVLRFAEDGSDLIRRLDLPVILLVSGFQKRRADWSLARQVLTKPLQGTQLADAIASLRGVAAPTAPGAEPP